MKLNTDGSEAGRELRSECLSTIPHSKYCHIALSKTHEADCLQAGRWSGGVLVNKDVIN